MRVGLLAAGPLSSVLVTDGVAASQWPGYRRGEQMVSELFAAGSPGYTSTAPFTWLCTALFTAFGDGAWISVRGNRALRTGAGLLKAYGLWNVLGISERVSIGAFLLWPSWRSSCGGSQCGSTHQGSATRSRTREGPDQ